MRQPLGRCLTLDEFRHRELAEQDVGQTDPGLQFHPFHHLPAQRVHGVADHHRTLEQRRFERGGAAGHQRDVTRRKRLVSATVEQLDRHPVGVLPAQGFHGVPQAGHDRNNETKRRAQLVHLAGRGQDAWRDVLDLGTSAAGQQRHQGLLFGDAQCRTRRSARWFERNRVGERMADVGGRHAVLGIQGRFERKDAQHVIDRLMDLLDALGSPRPDRGADEVHGANPLGLEACFEVEIEIGCVDADEQVGRIGQQALGKLATDARDLAIVAQHFHIATHRQLVVRPPGFEPLRGHLRPADAVGLQLRPAFTQAAEQQARQQVTRGFAGDHGDAQRLRSHAGRLNRFGIDAAGRRVSARCHAPPGPGMR